MNSIKLFFTTLILLVCFDFLWIGVFMSTFYSERLGAFARRLPGGGIDFHIPTGAAAYILMAIGITVFVLGAVSGKPLSFVFLFGALFGLVSYGIYDFTNYATLAGWSPAIMAADILWGTFLSGIVSVLVSYIGRYFGWL